MESTILSAYLSDVKTRLQGLVSEEALQHFVSETAFWIERDARNYTNEGSYEESIRHAIERHGQAAKVADEYLLEYYESQISSPVFKALGRGNTTALATFGLANILYVLIIQLRIIFPSGSALQWDVSPATIREYFPEPLPFPDFSWHFFALTCYPLLAPMVAGWICGRLIPIGAVKAVYQLLLLITVGTFLLGASYLPQTEGILYAILLAVYWLPVGCLTAHLSSLSFRRKCQKQRRISGGQTAERKEAHV